VLGIRSSMINQVLCCKFKVSLLFTIMYKYKRNEIKKKCESQLYKVRQDKISKHVVSRPKFSPPKQPTTAFRLPKMTVTVDGISNSRNAL
jgi:hypothetical protein